MTSRIGGCVTMAKHGADRYKITSLACGIGVTIQH